MPLRPEEKRSVLSALLQYQQRFGEGAMAGMQETRQREFGLADEERQRKAQMEDARRKAALGLITQPLGREGEQIPLSEHLGIVAGDRPVTEDIMPYTPEREVDPLETRRLDIRERELQERINRHKQDTPDDIPLRDIDTEMLRIEAILPDWWKEGKPETRRWYWANRELNDRQKDLAERYIALEELKSERLGVGGQRDTLGILD